MVLTVTIREDTMAEPIIIHQEGFDVACGALEAEQRFDHSLAMLFVSLAYLLA